jgi:hypothetical protein
VLILGRMADECVGVPFGGAAQDVTALRQRLVMALVDVGARLHPLVEPPPVQRSKITMDDLYANRNVLLVVAKVFPDVVPSRDVLSDALTETLQVLNEPRPGPGVVEGWGYCIAKMIAYLRPACHLSVLAKFGCPVRRTRAVHK